MHPQILRSDGTFNHSEQLTQKSGVEMITSKDAKYIRITLCKRQRLLTESDHVVSWNADRHNNVRHAQNS